MSDDITLTSLSPLDGRYRSQLTDIAALFSEHSLIFHRLHVEIEYILFLADNSVVPQLSVAEKKALRKIVKSFTLGDAQEIKKIEEKTHHDVKAVEYFLRHKLESLSIPIEEYVHLALTSEDTNSLALGLMMKKFQQTVALPQLRTLLEKIAEIADEHAETAMLARTHGQPAVPTTLGKEFLVFAHRLYEEMLVLEKHQFKAKMSGAVGNFNAHHVAFSTHDWPKLGEQFIRSLGLQPAPFSTQIVPAETYTQFFSMLVRINTILIDLNQDMWRYISDGYLIQKNAKGQVGSSTMPHKVNPIDFENSEGNLGLANSLLTFFIQKLPISRLQRDLSDSTVKRSFGSALAYASLGYRSLLKGLHKISAHEKRLHDELDNHWEIVSEGLQVVLRASGDSQGYEKLQTFLQGKHISKEDLQTFIESLDVTATTKKKLLAISPFSYTGLSSKITARGVALVTKYLKEHHELTTN
jgi:adenylosuccinate lyase